MPQSEVLALLPESIRLHSISTREIVLPEPAALQAIDYFEEEGLLILGWEGWIKTEDGRVGHGTAPQGTASLEALSVGEAAHICRTSIPNHAQAWRREFPNTTDALHFCLTVRTTRVGKQVK
jgi:hypothetical protein